MSNGAYAEITRLIKEGKLSDEAIARLSIELQLEIHSAVTDLTEASQRNSARLDKLEAQAKSIPTYLKEKPAKTALAISSSFLVLDYIGHNLPDLFALLKLIP